MKTKYLQMHYTHEMLIGFLTSPHLSKALNNGSKIKGSRDTGPSRPGRQGHLLRIYLAYASNSDQTMSKNKHCHRQ
jgi:hypothetical protein